MLDTYCCQLKPSSLPSHTQTYKVLINPTYLWRKICIFYLVALIKWWLHLISKINWRWNL